MDTKKITLNELRNVVKKIIKEELNESRIFSGVQDWVERFYLKNLIRELKGNTIIYGYIENGEEDRFWIPLDDKYGNHPFTIMADEISKLINKPLDIVLKNLKEVGIITKRDKEIMNSPFIYSGKMGLENFYEIILVLVFRKLSNGVDGEKANELYQKYKNSINSPIKPSEILTL